MTETLKIVKVKAKKLPVRYEIVYKCPKCKQGIGESFVGKLSKSKCFNCGEIFKLQITK